MRIAGVVFVLVGLAVALLGTLQFVLVVALSPDRVGPADRVITVPGCLSKKAKRVLNFTGPPDRPGPVASAANKLYAEYRCNLRIGTAGAPGAVVFQDPDRGG
jgi:hypothetical protein